MRVLHSVGQCHDSLCILQLLASRCGQVLNQSAGKVYMTESQNTEYKSSWRDEYLKWISAFANAGGGVLEIGKDGTGQAIGLPDVHKLLEDLPNKIRDVLGLIVAVNLRERDGKEWLEIPVAAAPYPVSYKGEYHIRSGSTRQELKGAALDQFLLHKQGLHWDAVAVPGVSLGSLDKPALAQFRTLARQSGRLSARLLKGSDAELVERLRLSEGRYLKRAAVLLFHAEPTRFLGGAFVKIGYFRTPSEVLYHDEINGTLFGQVHGCLELLQTKYLKAVIHYQGIQRMERLPVPEAALREALLNALVHRDYALAAPVQIRVYQDRLTLWNPAILPQGWTLAKLRGDHPSIPFNPDIANAFFRAGEVEAWGRGIQRIYEACREEGTPEPRLSLDTGELQIEFPFSKGYLKALGVGRQGGGEAPVETPVEMPVEMPAKTTSAVLVLLRKDPNMTLVEVAERLGKSVSAVERAAAKLREQGRLRHVGPRKGGHWEVLS